MFASILRNETYIVSLNGMPYEVSPDHPHYKEITKAIEAADEDLLQKYLQFKSRRDKLVEQFEKVGMVYDRDRDRVLYNGIELPLDVKRYMLSMMDQGTAHGIVKFVKNTWLSSSNEVRMRLFEFINRNSLPITLAGTFIAYKVVRDDFTDKHTGKIYNLPGRRVTVSWAKVDTNCNKECSQGLHACSYVYLDSFYAEGDKVVSVEIAPQDVGAIPAGYDGSKLRCRGYKVMKDITERYLDDRDKAKEPLAKYNKDQAVNVIDDNDDDDDDAWSDDSHPCVL